jgi:hypothetical protein
MLYLINLAAVTPHDLIPFAGMILPVVIIGLFVAMAIVSIVSNARSKREMLRFHHEQSLAAYEKGLPPPELPAEVLKGLSSSKNWKREGTQHGHLFWGVALLIVPLGYMYFNEGFKQGGQAVPFIILFALGVGNLLLFFVRRKEIHQKEGDEKKSEEEGI